MSSQESVRTQQPNSLRPGEPLSSTARPALAQVFAELFELRWWLVVLAVYLFVIGHLEGVDPAKPAKMNLLKTSLVTGVAAWGLASLGLLRRVSISERTLARAFSLLALLCLFMMHRSLIVSHVARWDLIEVARRLVDVAGLLVIVAYPFAKVRVPALVLAIAGLIATRAIVLWVSPDPRIDVFTLAREASAALWRGENPYAAQYGNLYAGTELDLGYSPGYNYFPLILLFNAVSDRLFHDVRAGFVLAEALSAVSVVLFARALGWSWRIGLLLGVIWSANGLCLQIVEKWNDSLPLATLFATLAMLAARRWTLAGIALGLGVATKQYLPLAVLPIGLWLWTTRREHVRPFAVSFVLTAGALFLPFLLNQGDWMLARTLLHFGRTPFREDSISLLNAAHLLLGFPVTSGFVRIAPYLGLVAGIAAAGFVLLRRARAPLSFHDSVHGLVVALLFVWSGFFHFIKQSFLNYYYFLFGVSVLLLVSMVRRDPAESGEGDAGVADNGRPQL